MAAAKGLRFVPQLKELRLHLCQKSSSSQGVRDFIEKSYVSIKQGNPNFPILVRECSGIQPKIYARYEYGKETSQSLADLNSEQVLQTVERLNSS